MAVHNLPHHATPFVGRLTELSEITNRLNDPNCRLLTLVGPGGIGKTRLAVEVVENTPGRFAHGIYFVNFQPVASTDVLVSTIADTLNIPLSGRAHPQARLLEFLYEKEMLLVLDNLEHLLDGVEWVSDLLANAPGIRLLTTSREALKLQEEWLYPVRGLAFPTSTDDSDIERYEAVQVFLQSARRVQPDFLIAREQAGLVRICRQTEGIPLAVEMAASWVKVLSCEQIADKMQSSLNFLTAAARNVPERHRSIRAVFDHSWRLLHEKECQVFRQLSVFHGGFTLDAAEQVAGASLSVIAALVEKSLLRRLPSGRYDMHELLRQFGAEKLHELSDEHHAVRGRHAAYYVEFLHGLTKHMRNEGEYDALQAIEEELDNVRACWECAIEQVNVDAFRKCEETLRVFYHVQDRFYEGERVFGRAAAALEHAEPGEERDITFALLLIGQGKCCLRIGQHERAKEMLERSVAILRRYNLPRELGWALYDLSRVLHEREEFREATQVEQESLALGEAVCDEALIAWSYFELSFTVRMYGNYSDSLHFMQECVARLTRTGDQDGIAIGLRGLAERLRERGEYNRSKTLYQQSINIHRKHNYKMKLASVLEGLGNTLLALGDYAEAREMIEESLVLARELGYPRKLAFSLISLGNLAQVSGNLEEAEYLFHETMTIAIKTTEPWLQALSLKGLGRIALSRGQHTDAQQFFRESLLINHRMEFLLETAVSLSDLGRVAVALGSTLEARQFFGDALNIGLKLQIAPVLLESIAGIAELFSTEGNPVRAMQLLVMVLDHPASHHEIKGHAAQLLDMLSAEHSIRLAATAQKHGEVLTLEMVAADLLAEFMTVLGQTPTPAHQRLPEPLTRRELEILQLVAEGLTNREIATRLFVSVGTIKKHNGNVFDKLGIKSRTQAIARARELNLIKQ